MGFESLLLSLNVIMITTAFFITLMFGRLSRRIADLERRCDDNGIYADRRN